MSEESFDFRTFIDDSKNSLLNPKGYFETMKTTGGMVEPLIKAVLYGTASGILYFIWSLLNFSTAGGLFGGAIGVMVLVWAIIGSVIGLFIGSVIVLVISAISKGNTDFEACMRVTASLMVLMPVVAFLSIFSGLSGTLHTILRIAVNLYLLWILYLALVGALKANAQTSKVVTIVLVALMVLFLLAGMGVRRSANRYIKNLENNMDKETKEMLKEFGFN
jgi:hypothetical protein